jgi:acyl carrier protein
MDSIDMVNLFVGLEAAIGRSIPPELISPQAFASIESLVHALGDLVQGAAQPAAGDT